MPSPIERLIGLSLSSIQDAAAAYAAGGNLGAFEREMQRIIATASTATYLTATAQRLGLDPSSPLFAKNRLTRAERADINAQIAAQTKYLQGFIADIKAGKLSPAQIAARAQLYAAGTVRTFYYQVRWGDWDIPPELYPGQQECMGNCKCRIVVADNGDGTGVLTRTMHADEHCDGCEAIAGDHPVKRRGKV